MGSWQDEVTHAVNASLALSTRVSYKRYLSEFSMFWTVHDLTQEWPILLEHLLQFVIHLRAKGLAVKKTI